MFPSLSGKQMEAAMKKLGIKTESVEATEVVIRTAEKEIVISKPSVTIVEMPGQKTFQIAGEVSERELGAPSAQAEESISEEDIKIVCEKTGASEDKAKEALEKTSGDIAEAIALLGG